MRFFLILIVILSTVSSSLAGSLNDYSNLSLLPKSNMFDFKTPSTNINLGKIETNTNTSISFGIGTNINEWSLCSGKYSLNSNCIDSQFNSPLTQALIGPQVNFESKSQEGGFESNISYTSSKTLPISPSQAPANINQFKIDSSVNLNLTNNAQLKFIGDYKHRDIEKNPNSILNSMPKDEFGVGLKLNIGF